MKEGVRTASRATRNGHPGGNVDASRPLVETWGEGETTDSTYESKTLTLYEPELNQVEHTAAKVVEVRVDTTSGVGVGGLHVSDGRQKL